MKKQIIALAVAVLLAAASIVVYSVAVTNHNAAILSSSSGSSFPDPYISGVEEAEIQHEVAKMTVENYAGTLTYTPKADEDSTYSNRWYIAELDNRLSHDRNVHAIAGAFMHTIPFSSAFEVTRDQWATYGLGAPSAKVIIELKDGTTHTYTFGTSNGLGGDSAGYYMMHNDNNVVYVVEAYYYNVANYALSDVISNDVISTFDESAVLYNFHISGSELEEVKMTYDDVKLTYHITEPDDTYMSLNSASSFVLSFNGLECSYVAAAYYDEIPEDMYHFLGFDRNRAKITIEYYWDVAVTDESGEAVVDGEGNAVTERKYGTITLLAGSTVNDPDYGEVTYIIREGMPVIYAVAPSSVAYWTDFSLDDNVSKLLYTKDMYTVDTLTFVTDFKTFVFDLSVTTQLDSVTLNGNTIDVAQFRSIYSALMALQYAERTSESKPDEAAYMTVLVKDIYGNTDEITFTAESVRRYFVTINGKGNKLISYQPVDELLAMVKDADKSSLS